jgi:hypothetical protein
MEHASQAHVVSQRTLHANLLARHSQVSACFHFVPMYNADGTLQQLDSAPYAPAHASPHSSWLKGSNMESEAEAILTPQEYDASVYGTARDDWSETGPCTGLCLTVVIFGATGDLAAKKTFPSLASLCTNGCAQECLVVSCQLRAVSACLWYQPYHLVN